MRVGSPFFPVTPPPVGGFGGGQRRLCLLVINTNVHPISHRFEVIADYCSNLVQIRTVTLRFKGEGA